MTHERPKNLANKMHGGAPFTIFTRWRSLRKFCFTWESATRHFDYIALFQPKHFFKWKPHAAKKAYSALPRKKTFYVGEHHAPFL